MRLFGRILGWLFLLAALATLGYDLARLAGSQGFSFSPLGQVWYNLHSSSLNLIQAIVERYIWEPLWDPVIATLLLWPALFVFLVPGLLLVVLCRRRERPTGFLGQ